MKNILLFLILLLVSSTYSQSRDVTYGTGSGFSGSGQYIYSSVLQTDGKLLIAGDFDNFNGTSVNNFIRLNQNGTIDTAFKNNLGTGFNYPVGDVAVQNDGKIIVLIRTSATNTTFNGNSIRKVIRLNQSGTLDNTFNYYRQNLNFNSQKIAIQQDGKILVGDYNGLVRANNDGSLDNSFTQGSITSTAGTEIIKTIKIDENDKILVAGTFVTYNGQPIKKLIRLNTDGSIDNTFNIGNGFESSLSYLGINSLEVQNDNKIVLGGEITEYNATMIPKVVRLNSDGSIDNTFNFSETNFDKELNIIKLQSNGSLVVTGRENTTGNGYISVARLNSNGQNDNSLNISNGFFGYECHSLQIQPDGKFIFLGDFYNYGSTTVNRIVRITNPVLSTEDFALDNIEIYPNPSKNIINLKSITDYNYEIYDISGKTLIKERNNNNNKINIESLKNGIYFLRIFKDKQVIIKKIIKK